MVDKIISYPGRLWIGRRSRTIAGAGKAKAWRLSCPQSAFNLIELLVVIAIIALLASLLLPSLTEAKQQAHGIQCLNNLRQLGFAWQMYVGDHEDRIPPNTSFHDGAVPNGRETTWVEGWLDAEAFQPDNTNRLYLVESHLWPYHRQLDIWKCPSDHSTTTHPDTGAVMPRVRTVSMNKWLNCQQPWNAGDGGAEFKVIRKTIDRTDPAPAQTLLLIDERADSINDGHFVVTMNQTGPNAYMVDFPGSYHRRAAAVNFADGHSLLKRWRDPRTHPPLHKNQNLPLNIPSPNNPDVAWLQEHTTGRVR